MAVCERLESDGPRREYWEGNANALPRPTLYTHQIFYFSLCGTMFHTFVFISGDVALCGASDTIVMRQSCGRGVHRIIDQARAINHDLNDNFDDSPGDT